MTEWTVVGVIIAMIGLVTAIVTPAIKLNTIVTKLNCTVAMLQDVVNELKEKNSDSHAKLWKHNDMQDSVLSDHETRISILERHRGAD